MTKEEGMLKRYIKTPNFLFFLAFFLMPGCSQNPSPTVSYGLDDGAGSAGIHTVLEGDTVFEVSEQYKLPMRDIIVLNKLIPPYKLTVGYRMKLPPPNEYKVRAGDTLSEIARLFEVSSSQIVRLNNLQEPYKLKEGQILRLPSPQQKPKRKESVANPNLSNDNLNQRQNISLTSVQREKLDVEPRTKPEFQQTSISSRIKVPSKTPPRSRNGRFLRPVEGQVLSSYGAKKDGLFNDGINFKVPRGTPVRSAENGVVVYVGDELDGYGNLVLVRHADQWMSAYAHLDKSLVQKGAVLKRGQTLGTVGSSGQVDMPQLHFELRRGTKALNPEKYL